MSISFKRIYPDEIFQGIDLDVLENTGLLGKPQKWSWCNTPQYMPQKPSLHVSRSGPWGALWRGSLILVCRKPRSDRASWPGSPQSGHRARRNRPSHAQPSQLVNRIAKISQNLASGKSCLSTLGPPQLEMSEEIERGPGEVGGPLFLTAGHP